MALKMASKMARTLRTTRSTRSTPGEEVQVMETTKMMTIRAQTTLSANLTMAGKNPEDKVNMRASGILST